MTNYKSGSIVTANVTGVTKYGIFVKVDEIYDGLIHISEISDKYVQNPRLLVKDNEKIFAEVIECDQDSKHLKLSIKNVQYRNKGIRKRKIVETKHGFDTLLYKLPFWIEENIKNHKNEINSIDK